MLKRRLILSVLAILTTLFTSSCSYIGIPVSVPIDIPTRPALVACPDYPQIKGKIVDVEGEGKHVMFTREAAVKLRDFISEYVKCSEVNQIELQAHIEKLENRLKVLKGD